MQLQEVTNNVVLKKMRVQEVCFKGVFEVLRMWVVLNLVILNINIFTLYFASARFKLVL